MRVIVQLVRALAGHAIGDPVGTSNEFIPKIKRQAENNRSLDRELGGGVGARGPPRRIFSMDEIIPARS